MTNVNFDSSLKILLQAFAAHQDLRQQHADIPTLAKSSHELHKARMAAYLASR